MSGFDATMTAGRPGHSRDRVPAASVRWRDKVAGSLKLSRLRSVARRLVFPKKPVCRFLWSMRLIAFAGALLGLIAHAEAVQAQSSTFTLQSVNNNVMVLANGSGDTITVSGNNPNSSCFSINASGRVTLFATTSPSACNSPIIMTFATNGFNLGEVLFSDIDDMDGTAPRELVCGERSRDLELALAGL